MSNEKIGTKADGIPAEIRFNVRVPANLHAAVVEQAKANGRSMNAEIIAILSQAVGPETRGRWRQLRMLRARLDQEREETQERLQVLRTRSETVKGEMKQLLAAMNLESEELRVLLEEFGDEPE